MMGCAVESCDRKIKHREWCGMHYQRWWKHGDPAFTVIAPRGATFTDKIDRFVPSRPASECWIWQGTMDPDGYGRVWLDGGMVLTHRASYEAFVGSIPEGLEIDHLCLTPSCVNPEHLEPVTHDENMSRANERRRLIFVDPEGDT
jgi:hypothetical protein